MYKKISIGLVVCIILLFVFAAFYSNRKADTIDYSVERQKALEEAAARPSITINTKHQFKNGVHTFLGFLEVPTPCFTHDVSVKRYDDITEIAIVYADTKNPEEVCAQVITEKTFKITFEGTEDENIIATLNGETVNLNVFEIDPSDNIEEADIFIKG